MKPQFYKTGIISTSDFIESDAKDLITARRTMSYTPVKDTNNSCLDAAYILYDLNNVTNTTVFRVIAKVSWSGFDSSSTAGTFSMNWQGSSYNTANAAWEWQGGNHVTNALNAQKNVGTLVLSAASGFYIYDTTYTVSGNWLDTWSGSYIGFRANYSNGVGKITIHEIKIFYDKYSTSSTIKQRFGKDYLATDEIIEL